MILTGSRRDAAGDVGLVFATRASQPDWQGDFTKADEMRLLRAMTWRLFLILGLAWYCGVSVSAPTDLAREPGLSTIDFEGLWLSTSDANFPKDALKAFPEYAKRELTEAPLQFVWVNLDGSGENEIIVASRLASGSGGTGYFILSKVAKAWQLIAEFQGGIVLSLEETPSQFYRIISYYRSGSETYQRTYDYQDGKYRSTGEVRVPGIVSHSCWWQHLWSRLNSYGNGTRKSAQCDPSVADRKRAAPPSSTELTAFDFGEHWLPITDPSFPKAAIKAFPKDIKSELAEDHIRVDFLSVDLVGDGQKELIVNSPTHGGSGGSYDFILKKNGKTWERIGEFLGGLVLSLESGPRPSTYQITSYYRAGETYQQTYNYRDGKYRVTNQLLLPRVIYRSCWWISFWSSLVSHRDPAGGSATEGKKHWRRCRDE